MEGNSPLFPPQFPSAPPFSSQGVGGAKVVEGGAFGVLPQAPGLGLPTVMPDRLARDIVS